MSTKLEKLLQKTCAAASASNFSRQPALYHKPQIKAPIPNPALKP